MTYSVLIHELGCHIRGPLLMSAAVYMGWPLWERLVAAAQVSNEVMFAAATCTIHSMLYVVLAVLFFGICCDGYGWCASYRLIRRSHSTPSRELRRRAMFNAACDQLFSAPLALYLAARYDLIPIAPQSAPRPHLFILFVYFLGALLWHEVLFYASHRTLHSVPFLYRHVHKKHHEFVGTVAIAAEHAHPLENFLGNAVPTVGFLLFVVRAPQPVWFVWFAARMQETYESHSGYCFEEAPVARCLGLFNGVRARHHDLHHTANRGNFGGPLLDHLCGTTASSCRSEE